MALSARTLGRQNFQNVIIGKKFLEVPNKYMF